MLAYMPQFENLHYYSQCHYYLQSSLQYHYSEIKKSNSAMKTKDSTHTSVIGFNTSVQTTMKNKFKIHTNIIAPPSRHFFLFFQMISFQDTGIPQLALLIVSRKTEH
jgi:hypothetical protein